MLLQKKIVDWDSILHVMAQLWRQAGCNSFQMLYLEYMTTITLFWLKDEEYFTQEKSLKLGITYLKDVRERLT